MSVLDTNYLVSILQGKGVSELTVDMIDDPKTTAINAYELYYQADAQIILKNHFQPLILC